MKIAMYGGTFNPPHLGHMAAAEACVQALGLDLLLLIPTRVPPHKILPEGSATPEQRLELCRIAAAQLKNCQASGLELEREGPSYTCDTLEELARQYPAAQLWLVVGTDMLLSFDHWREPKKIAGLCRLAAVSRNEGDRQVIWEKAAWLEKRFSIGVDVIDAPARPLSSTQVRERPNEENLHPAILEYLYQSGLYLPSLEDLRQAVKDRVSEKRYAHTLGCEKLAAQMAEKYGAPEYLARAAAILHDCTKGLSPKEQLTLAEKWNIIYHYDRDNLDLLIHADTGAETALREFHLPREGVEAIRTHTTGAEDMSALQKILYVADMCEETRNYPGVERLRALAVTDLDAAVTAAMERTVVFVRGQGREPYDATLRALAARKSGKI